MGNYVRVPVQDWQNICNSVRSKTGGEALLLSGEVSPAIDGIQSGGGEKILYMDAALLNAGGAYPADADDYTTEVIPAEATFVSLEAFDNLPLIDTFIVNGDCEFETYGEYNSSTKTTTVYHVAYKCGMPIKKVVIKNRTSGVPEGFLAGVKTTFVCELENCSNIGARAFGECYHMRGITMVNVTGEIGSGAFSACRSLTNIVIPEGVTDILAAFFDCRSLEHITIPASVTNISDSAFDIYAPAYPVNPVIHGYAGSYAETWAADNGYTFEGIE
jgi:hypothetical protein